MNRYMFFCHFYHGKQPLWLPVLFSVLFPSKMGSTLTGGNLLLQEQILSFKSRSSLKREAKKKMVELLPFNMYLFTLLGSHGRKRKPMPKLFSNSLFLSG